MKNLDEIKFDEKKRQQAGMTVPEGFFEQFQMQLEAKIDQMEEEKKHEAPVIQMAPSKKSNWITRWSVAACAIILIGVGAFVMTSQENEQEEAQIAAQSDKIDEQSEMEEMMIHSVSDYDLYEYYCDLQ